MVTLHGLWDLSSLGIEPRPSAVETVMVALALEEVRPLEE